MVPQNDSYQNRPVPETSFARQQQRRLISPNWQPRGFERYGYQKALLDSMDTLSGAGANPDRYKPATTCMDTLDCHCGE